MHPVRREILCFVAAYSTNELDIISPDGCSKLAMLDVTNGGVAQPTSRKISETVDPVSDCSPIVDSL